MQGVTLITMMSYQGEQEIAPHMSLKEEWSGPYCHRTRSAWGQDVWAVVFIHQLLPGLHQC
ncbi:hypothetical protein NITMOv2_1628 [Nitrospira moscoviensis]|uniref:Uncharacterized protein n=1 Tax=Nitrospira moscoviensis TaxID=42253 RepID=A0A0K2GBS4_NITMO|nr:hypothetical protein NITMOv2_1628 [Nitrospira moscoviensis]